MRQRRRVLLYTAAGIVVLTLVAMVVVPFLFTAERNDNRQQVTEELNPLDFALGDIDDQFLAMALAASAANSEDPLQFGDYEMLKATLIASLDDAATNQDALGEDAGEVTDVREAVDAYITDISDPIVALAAEGDFEGSQAVADGGLEPFFAVGSELQEAVTVTRAAVEETIDKNRRLDDSATIVLGALGGLGLISAAIVLALALGLDRLAGREEHARQQAELDQGRLNRIIDAMADGVALFDADGMPYRVNAAAEKMWGIPSEEIFGLGPAELTHPSRLLDSTGKEVGFDDLPSTVAMRENREVKEMVMTMERGSDRRDILGTAAPLHDETGRVVGAVAVWHDVTELRSVERLKDEFLSFAAHELRTPLTIVKGYASVLSRNAAEAGDREMARSINEESDRISALISQLLDVSRMESGAIQELELQDVPVGRVIEQVATRHRDVDPDREINVEHSVDGLTCRADPEALRQILDNLLSNARKYSDPGAPVYISVQTRDGQVFINIKDSGVGIPADELGRIGEKLYRASTGKGHEGSGLGMYIARRYLELHRGHMEIESEVNKGSTFTIVLPCDAGVAPGGDSEPESAAAGPF
ncbi:MAG: ATP-binding protein [Dehalococcoidia bacterium]